MGNQCGRSKVYIFAQKLLKHNTRIFKQAKSLVQAGYEVTVIGIQADGLPPREMKDGYVILRVKRLDILKLILAPLVGIRRWWNRSQAQQTSQKGVSLRGLQKSLADKAWSLWSWFCGRKLLIAFYVSLGSLNYFIRSYRVFQEDPIPPDIVHANDLDTLSVAAWVARKAKAKLVYDAQELSTEIHDLPGFYRRLLQIQEHVLIRRADRVIAVNGFIAQEMERRYRVPVNAVILNCPPFEDLTQATTGQTIRDKLGIPDEEPILLYSGGLTPRRGIENTLLALQFLERGILVLLGGGKLRGKLEALARAYRLSGRVHFVEFIPHEEVPRFISSADVGIIPYEWVGLNHYYSSPSKLFHYIMAELPVVGSDFPFLRQVILGNDIGATFDPSRPESITEAIRSLIGDPTRYRTVKDNLRRIKMKYCWENEEKKFLGVYQSLFLASSMSEESKPEVRLHDAV